MHIVNERHSISPPLVRSYVMALPLPPLFKPKLLLSPVVMQVARFLGVGARTIETRVKAKCWHSRRQINRDQ